MKEFPRVYAQLAAVIRKQIAAGEFKAGDKLPAIGDFAVTYRHSRQTVMRAMSLLAGEHLVHRVPGLGWFVDGALTEARARHPYWRVWISSAGRYWATRHGNARLTKPVHPGWAMTVDGDSLTELERRIEVQKDYEQASVLSPGDLDLAMIIDGPAVKN